jgi:hypothetical protein
MQRRVANEKNKPFDSTLGHEQSRMASLSSSLPSPLIAILRMPLRFVVENFELFAL